MNGHLNAVGLIDLVTGLCFLALAALAALGVLLFAPAYSGAPLWKPEDAGAVLATVVIISAILLLIGLPSLIAGIGLLMRKRWSHIPAILVAVAIVGILPLAMGAGLYSLWVLMQKETTQLLGAAG
jgi:hypothetical protein